MPEYGIAIHAFKAVRDGVDTICVVSKGSLRTLDEFEELAVDMACHSGMTGTQADIRDGQRMLATAKYIRALFSAAGMCEARRARG